MLKQIQSEKTLPRVRLGTGAVAAATKVELNQIQLAMILEEN